MSEMIEFPCPYPDCGKLIKTDAEFAGRTGDCPHCKRSVTVPSRRREMKSALTVFTNFADSINAQLRFVRGRTEAFWTYQRGLSLVGAYSLIIAGVIFAMQFGVLSVRTKNLPLFFAAIGCLFAAFLLHYVAARFALSAALLMRQNAMSIPSSAVPDSVGLLGFVAAVVLFFSSIALLFSGPGIAAFPHFFVAGIVLAHLAIFSLNSPECLNVHRDSAISGEGETAVSVCGFFARLSISVVPAKFCLLAVAGVVLALVATILAASGPVTPAAVLPADSAAVSVITEPGAMHAVLPVAQPKPSWFETSPAFMVVDFFAIVLLVLAGLTPLIGYFIYLSWMLVVRVLQSILTCGRGRVSLDE
jgi:hypothetical protein